MRYFLIFALTLLSVVSFFGFTGDNNPVNPSSYPVSFTSPKELVVGEELTYIVKYALLNLGELRFKVVAKEKMNGKNVYSAVVYMDSYNGLPAVDLHQTYETKLNSDYYSEFFRGIVKGKDYASYTDYFFNYAKKKVHVKKGKVNPYEVWNDTVGHADKMCQDGLSLFYFARMGTGKRHVAVVPCLVNEKRVNTRINFYDEVQKVRINAVNYDIAAVRLDGHTDFVGVLGLTGDFEGWFTDDVAGIPLKATMNLIIGKVSVELTSWKRPGWNPPRYKQ
jgi:hypothetical protein